VLCRPESGHDVSRLGPFRRFAPVSCGRLCSARSSFGDHARPPSVGFAGHLRPSRGPDWPRVVSCGHPSGPRGTTEAHRRLEKPMHVIRVTTDLTVPGSRKRGIFTRTTSGSVGRTCASTGSPASSCPAPVSTSSISRDATAPENPLLTVKVDDVDDAYAAARRRGYEVVHPLTTEPWGIRRLFVRAPDGTVLTIASTATLSIAQHRERGGATVPPPPRRPCPGNRPPPPKWPESWCTEHCAGWHPPGGPRAPRGCWGACPAPRPARAGPGCPVTCASPAPPPTCRTPPRSSAGARPPGSATSRSSAVIG